MESMWKACGKHVARCRKHENLRMVSLPSVEDHLPYHPLKLDSTVIKLRFFSVEHILVLAYHARKDGPSPVVS